MDVSDDLLDSSQEDTIVPNTYTSSTTFSTQVIKKLGIKSLNNSESEAANSIINIIDKLRNIIICCDTKMN